MKQINHTYPPPKEIYKIAVSGIPNYVCQSMNYLISLDFYDIREQIEKSICYETN
jgi:hypothetical protein